jgi:hypothetical protein
MPSHARLPLPPHSLRSVFSLPYAPPLLPTLPLPLPTLWMSSLSTATCCWPASSGALGPPLPQVPPTHDDRRPPAPWTQRPPPARGPLLRPSHVDGHSVTLGLSHCNRALARATPPPPAVGWHHRASPVLLRHECRPPVTATDLPHRGHNAHCHSRSSPLPRPSRRLPGRPRALTQQLCPRSSTFSHCPGPAARGQVIVQCQLARLLPVSLMIGLQ